MGRERWEHTLKPNHKSTIPRDWVFFDTESRVIPKTDTTTIMPFVLGVALYTRILSITPLKESTEEFVFQNPQDFVRWIEKKARKKTVLRVVAYNMPFDICNSDLLGYFTAEGWFIDSLYEKSTTFIARLHKGDKKVRLLDGLNFFRGSLKEWGDIIGLPKVDVDFSEASVDLLAERCKRDVEILHRMMIMWISFLKENDFGAVKDTLAAQAFATYRHKYLYPGIKIHANRNVLRLERAAYGGGMVRVFRKGKYPGPVFLLDVNSMYPYCMRQFEFPIRLIRVLHNVPPGLLAKIVQSHCVIVDAIVQPKSPAFRRKCPNGKIIYPTYKFRGVFSTPEVKRLLSENAFVRIHHVCVYRKAKIFSQYVENLYALRCTFKRSGNVVYERMTKCLLNSLYGKFGAKAGALKPLAPDDYPGIRISFMIVKSTGRLRKVYYFSQDENATPYVEDEGEESFNSFPAIAAHVAAYARMYLFSLIEVAGIENVFYSDTDSLIVTEEGYNRLEKYIGDDLGFLKLEIRASECEIFTRKDYSIGDKRVLKGVQSVQLVGDNEIYSREIWPSVRGWYGGKKNDCYYVYLQRVKLARTISDGIVDQNGHVIPFTSPPPFDPYPLELS